VIPIQNVYYMLSYAFQVLNAQGYKNIATERFHNTAELMAAILAKGIAIQIKRGLGKEYIPQTEALSALRGKLDIAESIKTQAILKKQMVCTYDDFSVNGTMNRIIKATVELLLKSDISKTRKKELRKLMVFFLDVEPIDLYSVNWNIQYNRNNQTYRLLISVCYLVVKGLLQTNSDGSIRLMDFLDEQRMHRLYEKFILEYYRKEFPEITANASKIPWQLDDGNGTMLPEMNTDIMLTYGNRVLIIDAKYYTHTAQSQFGKHTLHSGNLYQIFAYVKNKDYELADKSHEVSGMLLYAKTDEEVFPDNQYLMSGNKITVKTLDLNCDFTDIAKQLNAIVSEHFGIEKRATCNMCP
jgi:5-methylcytosine-specific restriction enzyme subunit McrC